MGNYPSSILGWSDRLHCDDGYRPQLRKVIEMTRRQITISWATGIAPPVRAGAGFRPAVLEQRNVATA